MADAIASTPIDGSNLRERPSAKPLHLHNSDDAKQKVLDLNEQEASKPEPGSQRTYGRTPDGTGMYTAPQDGRQRPCYCPADERVGSDCLYT